MDSIGWKLGKVNHIQIETKLVKHCANRDIVQQLRHLLLLLSQN